MPEDFVESTTKCAAKSCCFARTPIGGKAKRHEESDFCAWCDPAIVEAREKTVHGHRLIATALSKWATHPEILLQAWGRLSQDFRGAAGRQATRQKERLAMAKHDLPRILQSDAYGKARPAPDKKDGCKCEICGLVFLWRSKVKPFEIQTDGIESALSMDKIESAIEVEWHDAQDRWGPQCHGLRSCGYRCNGDLNLTRQLSDGRRNQDLIQCPSCYEARCSTCDRILLLQDYLWADCYREAFSFF